MSTRTSFWLAFLVLLIAAGLRLWSLSQLPDGLHPQEITSLRVSDAIRGGQIGVFYPIDGGREVLFYAGLALMTSAVGSGTIIHHIIPVWISLLTLALVYTLGVRLYGRVAGLAAMGTMALMLPSLLFSRTLVVESTLPLLVTACMLALARALQVYRREQSETSTTTAFATLGALLGISFYLHPISLLLNLGGMFFIVFILGTQPMTQRRLSYLGFSLLMLIIFTVPYTLSTARLPELAAAGRLIDLTSGFLNGFLQSLRAIFIAGDPAPDWNIPGRPLLDPITGLIALYGLVLALRYWRQPRFTLLLLMSLALLPSIALAVQAPNYIDMVAYFPLLALFVGLSTQTLLEQVPPSSRRYGFGLLAVLFIFNVGWTFNDFFHVWPARDDVRTLYRSDLGDLARHLDLSLPEVPTVLCDARWDNRSDFTATRLILRMMNRSPEGLRSVNCQQTLVFTQGGAREQIVFAEPDALEAMHPYLRAWVDRGQFLVRPHLPERRVLILNVPDELANAAGRFITTTPASYDPEVVPPEEAGPIAPPIRFGGNITWLGTERDPDQRYRPGDSVTVINYWRVEGMLPRDLNLFTHILSDPVTIVGQRTYLGASPRQLQERDVLIQVTYVDLPATLRPGEYPVSVGAYQTSSDQRLPVFAGEEPRGDRIFLYSITVE